MSDQSSSSLRKGLGIYTANKMVQHPHRCCCVRASTSMWRGKAGAACRWPWHSGAQFLYHICTVQGIHRVAHTLRPFNISEHCQWSPLTDSPPPLGAALCPAYPIAPIPQDSPGSGKVERMLNSPLKTGQPPVVGCQPCSLSHCLGYMPT